VYESTSRGVWARFRTSIQAWDAFKYPLQVLKQAGATLVHDVDVAGAKEYENMSADERHVVLDTDMKIAITGYLDSLATTLNNIWSVVHLIEFTKGCDVKEYPKRIYSRTFQVSPRDIVKVTWSSWYIPQEFAADNRNMQN
jgi:hypothetical protein